MTLTDDVADLLADLRHISGRLARFEEVDQVELDAFKARKMAVLTTVKEAIR